MTDSAILATPEAVDEDLGDLLLDVLPPDGSTIGNLSAREALSRAAERPISEEEYESIKDKALALGLIRKGRGRGGAIGLAPGIEGGSRYEAPSAPAAGNSRGRAKKEAPAKDFKAVLWASADKLCAQMDAAEYKHLVLGLIFTQENVFWVPADARWESLRAGTANGLIEWKDASGLTLREHPQRQVNWDGERS